MLVNGGVYGTPNCIHTNGVTSRLVCPAHSGVWGSIGVLGTPPLMVHLCDAHTFRVSCTPRDDRCVGNTWSGGVCDTQKLSSVW